MEKRASCILGILALCAPLSLVGCVGEHRQAAARDGVASEPSVPAPAPSKPAQPQPKIESVYRCESGANTMYFVFLADGTYDIIAREHMFVARLERGTWKGEAGGGLTIEGKGDLCHLLPVEHRARTFLSSPDHRFVSIAAPTPERGKEELDNGGTFNLLFLKADPAQCVREWGSAHPFTATGAQGLEGTPPFLDLDPPK
jgi:hypothetical protein